MYLAIRQHVHSMLLSVSASYFFRVTSSSLGRRIPPTVRHLSVAPVTVTDQDQGQGGCLDLDWLKKHPVLNKLRTLLVFDGRMSAMDGDILRQLEAVRVLDLTSTNITADFPKGIGKLKHLRYLGLPKSLKKLPEGVNKLLHLQALVSAEDKLQGSVELCADSGCRKPGHGLEALAHMNSLCGELSIKGLQAVSNREEAHRAHLERKEFLKVLKLEWEPSLQLQEPSESSHEQVLEGLKPPCKIEELHIRQYLGRTSPSWLESNLLSGLRYLYLRNCRNWQVLPTLSQLPHLKVICIKEMCSVQRIDHRLYGGDGVFKSLETLILDDMPNLVEWAAEATDEKFPHLQKISMLNCPKLEKLPRVPRTVRNMEIQKHPSCYLHLSPSSSSSSSISFTLDIRADAVHLLHEDFLHPDHIKAIGSIRIEHYTWSTEPNLNLLASVRSLSLTRCPVTDRSLSMCLHKLQSLERLEISDCPELHDFPDDAMPMMASLKSLEFNGCHPLLMKKLQGRTGAAWERIRSIQRLEIV